MSDPIIERLCAHKRYNRYWALGKPYSYGSLWYKDQRAYYGKLEREWYDRVDELNALVEDLRAQNSPRVRRHSLTMARHNIIEYAATILKIREENNRMLIRKTIYYIFTTTTTNADDNNRILSNIEVNYHHMMPKYIWLLLKKCYL